MLTAAVRDLKRAYPEINIDVRTPYSFLWKNNPHLTALRDDTTLIYPLGYKTPHQSTKTNGGHFIYAFHTAIEEAFGVSAREIFPL